MDWAWYAVKSIYETTVSPGGSAGRREASAERLVEERVVLVKAGSLDDALAKGEAEARRYAHGQVAYRNRDGDSVSTRYLGALDAFSIDGEPTHGTQVFSSLRIVRDMADRELLDLLLGPESAEDEERRKYEPDSPIE